MSNKNIFKVYSIDQCLRAQCMNLREGTCQNGLFPNNQKEGNKKLKGGFGYCPRFENREIYLKKRNFLSRRLRPVLLFRFSIYHNFQLLKKKLRSMELIDFNHYKINPFFSRFRFGELIRILNTNPKSRRIIFFKDSKSFFKKIRSLTKQVSERTLDYADRRAEGRPYVRARHHYNEAVRKLTVYGMKILTIGKDLIKDIDTQNSLIKRLFTPDTRKMSSLKLSDLRIGMCIFFLKSEITEKIFLY